MAESSGEKSQEPTQHRRQQAREQGQVPRSQDLSSAVLLLTGLSGLLMLGGGVVRFLGGFTRHQLGEAWLSADAQFFTAHWNATALELGTVLLPLLGLLMLAALALSLTQTGFLFLPERLVPDLSHIDPLKGLTRIFSLAGAVRLGFGILKIVLVAAVAYFSLAGQWETVLSMSGMELPALSRYMAEVLIWTSLKIAGALLLLALLDYGFQWWKQEQDLRMTSQEIREEMRNLQGDPQVIARRRAAQRQMAMNRLAIDVPKGDVTVTNPTELAVTIRFDRETMLAPIVIAKGAGLVAQRIRRLSLEHGIPIVERKPLAQALYKEVEINRPVPVALYSAVAEVLNYVYALKGKGPSGGN
jgi:flagellar biosynthetic protein FlhB